MSELKPCPFCGGKADYYIGGNGYLQCTRCIATIPYEYGLSYEDGKMQAIAKWNRRYQEPNEPLTLEQLREMDGEPVWCEIPSDNPQYGIVVEKLKCVSLTCGILQFNYYGEWKAYARKPESEEA